MITEKIKDLEDRGKKTNKEENRAIRTRRPRHRDHLLTGYYNPRGIPRQIHSKQMIFKTTQEGEKVAVELPD